MEIKTIPISKINPAPYNPRKDLKPGDPEYDMLLKGMTEFGLVEPLIWNKRTGTLVGGHQRISALDSLEKNKDYSLRVACVDLDEKTEREQNVFFNNPEAQGEFDLEKLETMFKDEDCKLNIDATGYDIADIYKTFGDTPLNHQPEELLRLSDQLREATARHEKIKEKTRARDEVDYYLVVVFPSNDARKKFTDERFVTPADLDRKNN